MLIGLGLVVWVAVVGEVSVSLFGVLVAVSGMTIAGSALFRSRGELFWLNLYRGCLYCVFGCMFISKPVESRDAMGLLASALLLVEGAFEIAPSLLLGFANRGARTAVGTYCIVAGLLIWMAWPRAGDWLIHICLAIDLIMTGCSLVVTAITERKDGAFAWYSLMGDIHRLESAAQGESRTSHDATPSPDDGLNRKKIPA